MGPSVMTGTSGEVPRSNVRYRWLWPHVPDAPELVGPTVFTISAYVVIIATFALPPVARATGISMLTIAAVVSLHLGWTLAARFFVVPRIKRSRRAFDVLIIGNAVAGSAIAASIAVLGGNPATVLWCALVLYATMNGALLDFQPSIGLQLIHTGVPLMTIPIFRSIDATPWSIAGPLLAAAFAGIGYHLAATFHSLAVANRRAVEVRLAASERTARDLKLARELHDVVGSTLGTVKLYAALLDSSTPFAMPLSEVAQGGIDDLRAVLDALAPPAQGHIAAALRSIARRIAPPGVEVEVLGDWPAEIDSATRVAIARIVQEATHNAIKHGGATVVTIALAATERELLVQIRDLGRGFDPNAACDAGRGLANMRARAAELDGELAIESRPGAGTIVRATLPILARKRSAA